MTSPCARGARRLQVSGKRCLKSVRSWLLLALTLTGGLDITYSAENETKKGDPKVAQTFEKWQDAQTLDGEIGLLDNPDGDAFPNLLEFALGLPADSGLITGASLPPSLCYNASTTKFDFAYQRPVGLPGNLRFNLLVTGMSGEEKASSLEAEVISAEGGLETVVYRDVERDPIFQSQIQGKLRLQVSLEGSAKGSIMARTPLWCWRRHSLTAGGSRSFTMPLVRQEVFRGWVGGMTPNGLDLSAGLGSVGELNAVLSPGESYYLEVLDGPQEGQRWEVDELACTATELAVDLTSPRNTQAELQDLTGLVIGVRPHQTIGHVLRMDRLLGATRQSQADRVQFWDRHKNRYIEYWLSLRSGNVRSWVRADDNTFADASAQVICPGEGVFVKVSSVSASLPLVGLCPEADLVLAIEKGTHFVGIGRTERTSPEQVGMLNKQGFCASTRSSQADRLRLWNNQSQGSAALSGYYLRAATDGPSAWVMEGDADCIDQNAAGLFNGFEAFFLIHVGATMQWRLPAQVTLNDLIESP
ncbi:MAG: hypothetical protein NTV80_23945 [Verrucomicrobia bacterium]|nr:hypothetical protein [Verrucomicrobiota bacterium]